jgi:hypothetical protein
MASAGIVAQTSSALTSGAREGTLVITGVSIVDAARGTTSAPQDVVVEGGRIAAIAPTKSLPAPIVWAARLSREASRLATLDAMVPNPCLPAILR